MTDRLASVLDLEVLREGWDFEAKSAQGRQGRGALPQDFWPTYSAMANTDGGRIVLGVKEHDDGRLEVLGLADPEAVVRDLWNLLEDRTKVSVNLLERRHVTIDAIDGKAVVSVEVPRAPRQDRPVFVGSDVWRGTYLRVHEGDRLVRERERIRRMLADATYDTRDDRILTHFGLGDLDAQTLATYRIHFRTHHPDHPWQDLDDLAFLTQLGAWRCDRDSGAEGLTAAGVLMFGTHLAIREAFPTYFVDYQHRDNLEVVEWVDRVWPDGTWSGNVFDFYRTVIRRLNADLRVPFALDQDLVRRQETHVHEAVREAFINALIHADWEGRIAVLAVKHPSGFSFTNPGVLRLPEAQVRRGGRSDCRNRTLQQMFLHIGYGEQAGSGFARILRAWREQSWRAPSLTEDPELDTTTLDLRMVHLFPEEVLAELEQRFGAAFRNLDETRRLALATAASEGRVSNGRMQELSDAHPRDLTLLLTELVQREMLEPHGGRRSRWYELRRSFTHTITHPGQTITHGSTQTITHGGQAITPTDAAVAAVRHSAVASPDDVRAAILALCAVEPRRVADLAQALGRSRRTIAENYVRALVREGRLLRARPDQPRHPDQAYITAEVPE